MTAAKRERANGADAAAAERDWVHEVHRTQRMSGQVHSPSRASAPAEAASSASGAPTAACPCPLAGVVAEVCVPLRDGQLELSLVADYAAALKADGVDTVCVGSAVAGEGGALSAAERMALAGAWAAAGAKVAVDVTAAGPDAAELARHAQSVGAAALLVHCPEGCGPAEAAALVAHAAGAARATPVLLRGGGATVEVLRAVRARVPTLAGAVTAAADRVAACLAAGFAVAVEGEPHFAAGALAGAAAFLGPFAAAAAPLAARTVAAAASGDVAEVRRLQRLAGPLADAVAAATTAGRAAAVAKVLAGHRLGRDLGPLRPPGPRLSVGEVHDIRAGMARMLALLAGQGLGAAAAKPAANPAAKPAAARKIDLRAMPFFGGGRNDFILERIKVLARRAALPALDAALFPHLAQRPSWRRLPAPGALDIATHIDHTVLKAAATEADVAKLCAEATKHRFCAVCVNGGRAEQCVKALAGTGVKVACVVGFPLGAGTVKAKAREAHELAGMGVGEIDMVMNVGAMKDGNYGLVYSDIKAVVVAAAPHAIVKVIFETCLLTEEQIVDAAVLSVAAGAHFVKTSTGFSTGGATPEAVDAMLAVVGNEAMVKASGGVSSPEAALAYVSAGVKRIGTSSGIAIISGLAGTGY